MPLPRGLRVVSNPPNPWSSTSVEYLDAEPGSDEGAPIARLEVIEDTTRNILAENDSPDLGFRWSLNPYRGCFHACAYCLSGDTRILMGDGTHRALRTLTAGDEVYGTERRGRYRHYVKSRVLDVWTTVKPAMRVQLSDGTVLVASPDHRFLTRRGWKYVTGAMNGPDRRPYLTRGARLLGTGAFAPAPVESDEYKLGYLCGMVRGDAHLARYQYEGAGRRRPDQFRFRLALADIEPLVRARAYLSSVGVDTRAFEFAAASDNRRAVHAIRTQARRGFEQICAVIDWPVAPPADWHKGFVAGIFDAEGTYSQGVLRISNTDSEILQRTLVALLRFGFDAFVEDGSPQGHARSIRVHGGLAEHLRFFHLFGPATTRKRSIVGRAFKSKHEVRVEAIEPLGFDLLMYDITTETGDFIAEGVVSHNCYARPRHEYLSLGAGTDFERKIVVKPNAPELLREAFDRPSWTGELIMFSGDTDCYQPLEASYELTRRCLAVCAEYKNPCGVITKSPLIERDVDVLAELSKVTGFRVTISIPLWDPEKARAMEPFVATPQRRIRTIERLAKAGVRVGVNIAPMIPGLGDEDMPFTLQAARDAGAVHAGFVFLRLPGPVAGIFEERIQKALPLRARKVLARVREARGGNLYDSRWGVRQRGEGPYAAAAQALFDAETRRLGFDAADSKFENVDTFERPPKRGAQLRLF